MELILEIGSWVVNHTWNWEEKREGLGKGGLNWFVTVSNAIGN